MVHRDDTHASLMQAIDRIEAALTLVDDAAYPTSAYLIERALDQMRADAWPQEIEGAPEIH
jgi:hypothetical protein